MEGRTWGDDRASGALFTAVGVLPAVGVGLTLRCFLGAARSTALAAMLSIAGRMLNRSAVDVSNALGNGDLDTARALLPALVGRDPRSSTTRESRGRRSNRSPRTPSTP